MKVYISVDYEGITGVVSWNQESEIRDEIRRRMTLEVNAAIEGALEAGAEHVLVNDAHNNMRNLIPEELHESASYVSGYPKPMCMVEGISGEFDAAFFIGYHAAAGTGEAVLDHTYSEKVFLSVEVNGRVMGETGINALVCGSFGVPVALVTGDDKVCREAEELIPNVTTAAVKKGIGRYSANSLHPKAARKLVKDKAREALKRLELVRPLVYSAPIEFKMELAVPAMADVAELIPGITRLGPRLVSYASGDYLTCFKVMRAVAALGGTAGIE